MDISKVFAYWLTFPGGTKEQYQQVIKKLHLDGKTAPGGIFHLGSISEKGIMVFDVWENKEAFDKFMSEKLAPALEELGIQGGKPEILSVIGMLEK